MPSYHNRPSAPTNLTLHQAIDVNGVIIVPAHLADAVALIAFAALRKQNRR
jgi:hypothetical protein